MKNPTEITAVFDCNILIQAAFFSDVAFSPDSKKIVTGGNSNIACVWNAETGQLLAGPIELGSSVTKVSFSDDEKFVLTVSGDNSVSKLCQTI